MSTAEADLGDLLAQVLPTGVRVTTRHLSSTPSQCPALFAAPPGQSPETTFCETHFLSVSVHDDSRDGQEVIVFGIEVLVYTTAHLTTIFISKADSTGLLHLLKAPRKFSLLRLVSNTFLSFIVHTRQRKGVRLVLSLFARAQNQYLFPGSIKNTGKHVLDDCGLIKWWCRVLDPILREYEPESRDSEKGPADQTPESAKSSATAFLIIPGCDKFEVRGFFPPSAKSDDQHQPRWLNSYPRQQLCRHPDAPPRCLVPRFPDDPKTRFLIDLDDELPEPTEGGSGESSGLWRSVKCLDQFWELMSFRQECSAGRLVGFLWVVVNPPGLVNSVSMPESMALAQSTDSAVSQSKPEVSHSDQVQGSTTEQSKSTSTSQERETTTTDPSKDKPIGPDPFYWPETGRGDVVLSETDYKSAVDFLLEHEFYDEEVSISSTKAWIDEVSSLADQLHWGKQVVGKNVMSDTATKPTGTNNLMDTGLIRKRKKPDNGDESARLDSETKPQSGADQTTGVNVLNASFIRKKKKT